MQSFFQGVDPTRFFGGQRAFAPETGGLSGPFAMPEGRGAKSYRGSGATQLPETFAGWEGAARYAFPLAQAFQNQTQGVGDFFREQMGKDWTNTLFNQSAEQITQQAQAQKPYQQQAATRAGVGGGTSSSPYQQYALQAEAAARAGQMGQARQMAVMQAEQLKSSGARSLMDYLTNLYQAYLTPATLQSARRSQVPIGGSGPSLLGPALNATAAGLGAFAGG